MVKQLRDEPDETVLGTARTYYERGDIWLAYEILRAAPRAMSMATLEDLDRLSAGMEGWAHVDCFASFASGVAWRLGRIGDQVIARWARSPDRWRRRAAVVSTIPLNTRARGAIRPRGDAARTLAVCDLALEDGDEMVQKAVSWALRELVKRDPAPVRRFLKINDARLSARVRREVTSKLLTGLKRRSKD
jgi:3-methyladenine DNA glycosylase AlkD